MSMNTRWSLTKKSHRIPAIGYRGISHVSNRKKNEEKAPLFLRYETQNEKNQYYRALSAKILHKATVDLCNRAVIQVQLLVLTFQELYGTDEWWRKMRNLPSFPNL